MRSLVRPSIFALTRSCGVTTVRDAPNSDAQASSQRLVFIGQTFKRFGGGLEIKDTHP
jgi:hypothetical protein